MSPSVRLATAGWVVDLEPDRGGSIAQITHQPTGIPLLFRSPWPAAAATPVLALGQRDWLARYGGGWHTVAPNGGDECVVEGVTHGWHGEASVAPWTVTTAQDDRLEMRLQLRTAPVTLGRQVTLHDSRLQVTETVHNNGNSPTALMWAHHAAFHSQHGGASPVIRTNAALAVPDKRAASRGIAAAELLSSLTSGPPTLARLPRAGSKRRPVLSGWLPAVGVGEPALGGRPPAAVPGLGHQRPSAHVAVDRQRGHPHRAVARCGASRRTGTGHHRSRARSRRGTAGQPAVAHAGGGRHLEPHPAPGPDRTCGESRDAQPVKTWRGEVHMTTADVGLDMLTVLAEGLDHPECVAAGPDGALYAGGEAGQVYRIGPDGTVGLLGSTGGFALGIALDATSRVYVCDNQRKAVMRVAQDGTVAEYSSGDGQRAMRTPNHLVFDRAGRLYVSDSGTFDARDGLIWVIDPNGATRVLTDDVSAFPNGLALDATETFLYAVQSNQPGVARVPITDGHQSGDVQSVVDLPGRVPDGLAFDESGALWLAIYAPNEVLRLTTDGRLQVIARDQRAVLLAAPTNVAFFGADRRTMAVASLARWHIATLRTDVAGSPLNYPELPA